MKKSYRDLRIWSESIDFAVGVYEVTEGFPDRERYGLTSQLRKAAVSVASNIAEGEGRLTLGEWKHFLGQARGSLYEIDTHLTIASRLGYGDRARIQAAMARVGEIGRGLNGLIAYVSGRQR